MKNESQNNFKYLNFYQVLLLLGVFCLIFTSGWFITKEAIRAEYSQQEDNFDRSTKVLTQRIRNQLLRTEGVLIDAQSFFEASKNIKAEELNTFLNTSQISKQSNLKSVFYVSNKSRSKESAHDILDEVDSYRLFLGSELQKSELESIRQKISQKENFQFEKVFNVLSDKPERNIHFLIPIFDLKEDSPIGFIGTTFDTKNLFAELGNNQVGYHIEVSSNKNSFQITNPLKSDSPPWLISIMGLGESYYFKDKESLSLAQTNWNIQYSDYLFNKSNLWLQTLPYFGLGSSFLIALLITLILFQLLVERERIQKRVDQKTEQLKEESLKFESIFNNTFQFMGLLKPDGTIIEVNDSALQFGGLKKEDLIGTNLKDAYWFEDREKSQNKIEKAIEKAQEGKFFREDIKVKSDKKDEEWVDFSLSPMYDENGELKFLVPEGRKITQRKRIEEELSIKNIALQGLREGISITDSNQEDNPLVYVNSGFEKLTGYSKSEALGRNCRFLQGSETEQEKVDKLRKAIKNEEDISITLKNYTKDGEMFWNELSISPIYNENDELIRFIAVQRDVTKRKRKNQKLENRLEEIKRLNQMHKRKQAKDEAILNSIGEGLVVMSKEGEIEFVNKGFESILGWKKEEVRGEKISKVIPLRDKNNDKISFNEQISTKVLQRKEMFSGIRDYYMARKDGSIFPVSVTVSPIELDGELIGAVEVFRDITKIKELDKAKSEFVSLASHQLRTPLTTINWYSEMLMNEDAGQLSDEQKSFVKEIVQNSDRMIDLVNALLNVSRIESGSMMVRREDVELSEIAEEVIEDIKIRIEEKDLEIDKNYDDKTPVIKGDPGIARIIFQNLISNAVKYTPEEGEISVRIYPKENKEKIYIEVEDNGVGIPENAKDKIFEKLYRADNVKNKDTEGTGLGLYIIKSTLQKVGGEIWFESTEDKGTTFFVTIPFEGMQEQEGSKSLAFGSLTDENKKFEN